MRTFQGPFGITWISQVRRGGPPVTLRFCPSCLMRHGCHIQGWAGRRRFVPVDGSKIKTAHTASVWSTNPPEKKILRHYIIVGSFRPYDSHVHVGFPDSPFHLQGRTTPLNVFRGTQATSSHAKFRPIRCAYAPRCARAARLESVEIARKCHIRLGGSPCGPRPRRSVALPATLRREPGKDQSSAEMGTWGTRQPSACVRLALAWSV